MKTTNTLHKAALIALSLLCCRTLYPQSGGSFFADFQLAGRANQGEIFSMAQDAEGNMQIATSNGVVIYDGSNTSLVGTGADVDELEYVPDMGKTYVGCEGRMGYISRNNFGKYIFNPIPTPGMEFQSFADIVYIGKDVYFESDDWVLKVSQDKVVQKWKRPSEGNFAGIIVLQNTVFVNVSSSGLYVLNENGTMRKHSVDDSKIAEAYIAFYIERSKGELILGTDENELYIFTGSDLKPLSLDKASYLDDNILTGGQRIDNNYMALTTYRGGLIVVNMYSGMISELYNTSTGFPDDQITCITVDNSMGIWTSHEYGLTRIDRNIPVKSFSVYPGLNGRVISVAESNGVLYAGCTDGLYWLKSADNAAEYEKAIKISGEAKKQENETRKVQTKDNNGDEGTDDKGPSKKESSEETPTTITPVTPDVKTDDKTSTDDNSINNASKKIKKLWQRAKDKVKGSGTSGSGGTKPAKDPAPTGQKTVSFYPSRSIFQFVALNDKKNTQFVYSKVPGLDAKIKKLLVTPSGLMCATNIGLYKYGKDGMKKVFSGDIKDMSYGFGKLLFVSSSGANILADDGSIYPIILKQKLHNLGTAYIESNNTIWLGEMNRVVTATISATGTVEKEEAIEVNAEFRDNITVCRAGDIIYLASTGGLFELQPGSRTAVKSTQITMDENDVFHFVINPAGNTLFVKTLEGWKEVKANREMVNLGLMDVISDLRYAVKTTNGSLWTVSGQGNVYYLNKNIPSSSIYSGFNVFIRGVNNLNGNAFDLSDLSISYRDAQVEFKWGSNLFLKSDGTWYQYKIEGGPGRNQWSPWKKETSMTFQMLPGSYTFVVRARDIFGNISPERRLAFRIKPPFWQTWWFYSLVALAAVFAGWFIFRWRNRALLEKQKLLETMVKERTLELAEEKEKTESLLLNILPKAVAQELKEVGQSSVRKHSDSAVMFTDFCDFTKLSKNMSPEELVLKLDTYFREFDEIVEKYGLEKIKTIGDSYMCAAGVPQPRNHSSLSIVMAALEILDVVENAESHWKIRVGIHQGGLVSGVVGKKKFAYDIWGDTVNVASRMESSSEPMNINITEQVYNNIKEYFDCEKRGEVEAKSLGKTNMYFVKGLKTKYRLNGSPLVPNKEFLALLN